MTNIPRSLVLALTLFSAATLSAATGGASFDITVKQKANGKVVFQGNTDPRGSFSTAGLEPGSYTVEFKTKNAAAIKGQDVAIELSTGKGAVTKSSAPAGKFSSGVALNVDVKSGAKLSGQVRPSAVVASQSAAELGRGKVKIENGKRYVWVAGEIGSQMGGRWVEEGTEGAVIKTGSKRGDGEVLQRMQDMGGQGVGSGR